jgi:circadian clock protein KaiC
MVTAEHLAKSDNEYKKFINELQTWVGLIGCTVLILTSGHPDQMVQPAHTMVDGIFELTYQRVNARNARLIAVTKFRGSGFIEGLHHYEISSAGLRVYPRIEAAIRIDQPVERGASRLASGVKNFDGLIGDGYAERSTTLLLGSSGAGKTLWGMHFLAEGARNGEPGLHFGFFENPPSLIRTAANLGLDYEKWIKRGKLELVWHKYSEQVIDKLGYELLELVDKRGIKRLFIDGLVGFNEVIYPQRVPSFFAVLTEELARRGVTTLISEETRELFVRNVEIPTSGTSATFENIIFLRLTVANPMLGRLVSVMKTRDANHSKLSYAYEMFDDRGLVVEEQSAFAGDLRTGPLRLDAPIHAATKKQKKQLLRRGSRK